MYTGKSGVAAGSDLARSIVIVQLWVYYAAQIF